MIQEKNVIANKAKQSIFLGVPAASCRRALRGSGLRLRTRLRRVFASLTPTIPHACSLNFVAFWKLIFDNFFHCWKEFFFKERIVFFPRFTCISEKKISRVNLLVADTARADCLSIC